MLNSIYFVVSLVIFVVAIAITLLRLSNYFRDRYRATHYGVLDLVAFIRQLDSCLYSKYQLDEFHRVELNFIAHSMGCFIATNTIRILSDVFDSLAINENPTDEIGKCFSLGRLVLVAPDIPVESISKNVSNYLASSLRRCKEA